jgi:phosphoenolpyruvate---glycerone phosphotransferase subunit DhaL
MHAIATDRASAIVTNLITTIQARKQYLSDIDGAIGDGDHGVNMSKGFTMAGQELARNPGDLSHALNVLGVTLLEGIGGSMGPLYGTFFRRMARACKGTTEVDAAVLLAMLTAALEGVRSISEAQPGDKTLLDTLVPAVAAYRLAVEARDPFDKALDALQAAAVRGMQSTRDMVAKVGRSSRLGERSRGVIDAGAASCCEILCSMAESIRELAGATQPA